MNRFWKGMIAVCALLLLLCAAACTTEPARIDEQPPAPTDAAAEAETVVIGTTDTPEPTEEPTEEPTPTPEPTEAPTPEPTPTPVPEPFTIVWITDTQNYAYANDAGLKAIVSYALEQKEALNIVAVLQSGDLVENNGRDREWEKIRDDLEPLRGVIPFYCVSGNHDVGDVNSIVLELSKGYDQYWKYDLCDVHDERQRYNNGECWYRFLEEEQLLLVGIGWNTPEPHEARNEWLDSVLDEYGDYPVLILTHTYLYNNGKKNEYGAQLEKDIVSRHPNIRLLVCGHHRGAKREQVDYEDGSRSFTAVMFNLQNENYKSAGYCALLTFDPLTRSVSFTNYSPLFDDYNFYDNTDKETFVLENAY